MPRYIVSIPFSIHVVVEADSPDDVTEETVDQAALEQHGKYPQVDLRNGGDFEVLHEEA